MRDKVFTVGHSNHTIEKLIELLARYSITAVCDVRSSPYSRYNPQFNRETLCASLKASGIAYVFLGNELGARSEDSSCYENGKVKFKLLADSKLFGSGLDRVVKGMQDHLIALLCSEKDPLNCHRTILVSRYLVKRGIAVEHILGDGTLESHDEALSRLLREHKLPEQDLFGDREEFVEKAYSLREDKIAFTEENTRSNQLSEE